MVGTPIQAQIRRIYRCQPGPGERHSQAVIPKPVPPSGHAGHGRSQTILQTAMTILQDEKVVEAHRAFIIDPFSLAAPRGWSSRSGNQSGDRVRWRS